MNQYFLLLVFSLTSSERVKHFCPVGQYWSGQSCLNCLNQYCTCSFINTCDQPSCGDKQVSNGLTCENCPIGCSKCQLGAGYQDYKCTSCDVGYQLIEHICFSKSWSQKQTLEDNFFKQLLTNKNIPEYIFYNLQICEELDEQDALCDKCPDNAFLNEYGLCEGCIPGCSKCTARGTCAECSIGYYWNTIANPMNDTQTLLNYGSGGCSRCNDTLAETCSDDGMSLTCMPLTFLSIKGTNDQICIQCIQGCQRCSASDTCNQCLDGWYKANNLCYRCGDFCQKCSSSGCETCQDNFLLLNGQCKQCNIALPGCLKCSVISSGRQQDMITCNECDNQYYSKNINSIDACQKCSDINSAWLFCDNPTQPTQCIGGYQNNLTASYLLINSINDENQLTCIKNDLNCLVVILYFHNKSMSPLPQSFQPSCSICLEKQILLPDGSCQYCPDGCTSCNVDSNGQIICALCKPGYVFTNQKCKVCLAGSNHNLNCQLGCQECTIDGACRVCQTQFTLKNGICLQCSANCEICLPDLTCVQCTAQYFSFKDEQSKQTCLECPPGCLDCQSTNGRTCQKCKPNYFPQGSGCSIGIDYCAVYQSDGSCQICKYGARMSNGRCQRCIDPVGGYVCGENAGFTECWSTFFVANWALIFIFMFQI